MSHLQSWRDALKMHKEKQKGSGKSGKIPSKGTPEYDDLMKIFNKIKGSGCGQTASGVKLAGRGQTASGVKLAGRGVHSQTASGVKLAGRGRKKKTISESEQINPNDGDEIDELNGGALNLAGRPKDNCKCSHRGRGRPKKAEPIETINIDNKEKAKGLPKKKFLSVRPEQLY